MIHLRYALMALGFWGMAQATKPLPSTSFTFKNTTQEAVKIALYHCKPGLKADKNYYIDPMDLKDNQSCEKTLFDGEIGIKNIDKSATQTQAITLNSKRDYVYMVAFKGKEEVTKQSLVCWLQGRNPYVTIGEKKELFGKKLTCETKSTAQ
jgi:hypothetical protein